MILEAANKYYVELLSDILAIKHYIKNNLGVFITILYLIGNFSGVIYLATLLNNFSVDVFQHIELNDFLFALISNPAIVLGYTVVILFTVIASRFELSRIPDPKKPTLLKKIYYGIGYPLYLVKPTYALAAMLLIPLCAYPYLTANAYSEKIKEKSTQSYSLSLNDPIQKNQTNLLAEVQIITSTSRNLFIYDNKKDKLLIIPQNNIAALVPLIKADIAVKVKSAKEVIKK
ncbi:hypothetical protein CXF85_02080 [Colwellia sp. 75C3]|uniref:hypothetical protein n=1 Tax=Colwellia sp. 75C3 TaxID=888425 RepID=UPI000C32C23A|nr:hypothetical protein [Colwellia sp. 75C3]PKG85605.1 hypothetical protein CXF85_02080 [Colwellia sp. 75C3]